MNSPEYNKLYYLKNKDKLLKNGRDKYKADPSKARDKHLKYTYDITLEEYNQLFIQQNGCCAICNRHQTEFKHTLDTDHNHVTGIVRGLLCKTCNKALGLLKADDSSELLEKALSYINAKK